MTPATATIAPIPRLGRTIADTIIATPLTVAAMATAAIGIVRLRPRRGAADEERIRFRTAITLAGATSLGIFLATHWCCLTGDADAATANLGLSICGGTR